MIDVAALLTEVAQDAPCGPDLAYDPEFIALEQAARGRPEQQYGDTTVAAEDPNWADVQERAVALWARTRDLRVAVLLLRALARLDDFDGLAVGLTLLQGLLERYWDQVHPRLDPEDDNDPTMRLNALAPLGDADTLLREVRNLYLLRPGQHGTVAVRNVLAALGKWPAAAGEAALNRAEIEGVLRSAGSEAAVAVESLRTSVRCLDMLRTVLTERVGIDHVPDLQPLRDQLALVLQVCDAASGTAAETEGSAEGGGLEAAAGITRQASDEFTGAIHNRDDAVRMLQRVVDFIERTEPANPAPLFIRRAQRLMTKSFVEIIQDLVPDSLGQIQKMAGLEGE